MKPTIVLLAGGIGAGKDTVADFLDANFSFTKLAFADPLKESASALFDFPCQWCYTRQGKEKKPRLGGGKSVGQILQLYGTEVGRNINPEMWAQLADKRIRANELARVAITDCRFENEARYFLRQHGEDAHVIFLTRQAGELQGSRDATHASENMGWAYTMYGEKVHNFHIIDNQMMSVEDTLGEVETLMHNILEEQVK